MPGTSTVTSFWGWIGRQFDLASDHSAGDCRAGRADDFWSVRTCPRCQPGHGSRGSRPGARRSAHTARLWRPGGVPCWTRLPGHGGFRHETRLDRMALAAFCEAAILGVESRCWQEQGDLTSWHRNPVRCGQIQRTSDHNPPPQRACPRTRWLAVRTLPGCASIAALARERDCMRVGRWK